MSNMPRPDTELTAIEERVVELAAQGMTNGEIGRELFLTEDTIRKHVQRACVRTRTRGRTQLVAVTVRAWALAERVPPAEWGRLLERERDLRRGLEAELSRTKADREAMRRRLRRVARMANDEQGEGES